MSRLAHAALLLLAAIAAASGCGTQSGDDRSDPSSPAAPAGPRMVVELDADANGRASLVRLLHYADQLEIEGLLVTDGGGAAASPASGLPAVRRLIDTYAEVRASLVRSGGGPFPEAQALRARIAKGDAGPDGEDGMRLLLTALRRGGPLWLLRWAAGTEAPSSLRRALDRLKSETSEPAYLTALARLRLFGRSHDLGDHVRAIGLCVDTAGVAGAEFSADTAALLAAGPNGDLEALLRRAESPFAAHVQPRARELGASSFLRLLSNGLNVADEPGWGGWGGRFASHQNGWVNWWEPSARDGAIAGDRSAAPAAGSTASGAIAGGASTMERWAAAVRADFEARLAWAEPPVAGRKLNRPPIPAVNGERNRDPLIVEVFPGDLVPLSAGGSTDPDGDRLRYEWIAYPEAGTYPNTIAIADPAATAIEVEVPFDFSERRSFHIVLAITDDGTPPLTRYRRIILRRGPW